MATQREDRSFPEGFLWGTATAAHQIEGGNWNSDWWEFENKKDTVVVEPSGDACDSLNRWEEDLDLVASFGLNSYRFSIEWSRIEPEEGLFSHAALDHYRRVCLGARSRGLLPIVTFHHFSSPRWFAAIGGFESPRAPELFGRYVKKCSEWLGDVIGLACTINEPNIVSMMGYGLGVFPPGVQNASDRQVAVNAILLSAHQRAVQELRSGPGDFPIGLTLSMAELVATEGGEESRDEFQEVMEDSYLRGTKGDDFIGVQCYSRFHFGPQGFRGPGPGARSTPMGYEWWPQCVGATARRAAAVTGLPVVVTENGVSTQNDAERIEYVTEALVSLHDAMNDGVDIRGYLYWSLLDNFEWTFGYGQYFGLVEVDRASFVRTPKASAQFYGAVARSGVLEVPTK